MASQSDTAPDALGEPAVVHQATGMISAHLHIRCSEALLKLRGYAAATDSDLTATAQAVVGRHLHPGRLRLVLGAAGS
ncbi:hypothetical protein AD006_30980 (plasmid) [Pseudonocardia sp. EC080610-09]|uniref:hypothetical protein n=1 Tax=unclassified Pseudonocardia TaxID=2619320 RepID=UPI000706E5A5|nr:MULTISPECIES: hypothetical protein [unclassified Pseudonocardia]ALL79619.1 hypothetical protein AD006_30980 [Pseudonocardia sp. EC080610-09]ALL85425.1 hypothetical protein AD017_30255 [Pseudonocardia sp. EC080619-01]